MTREEAYQILLDYISSVGGCGVEYWPDKDTEKMRECVRVLMYEVD